MTETIAAALAIAGKDIRSEFRRRTTLVAAIVFAALILVVFNFARDPTAVTAAELAPSALWITCAFATVTALSRTFAVEIDHGAIDGLLLAPVSREAIYLGKFLGNLVFVAGQTGRHPVTGEVGRDIREQTRNVLERIKLVLEAAGTSLDNVLTVTTHLTKREDLAAYNEEYAKYFPANKPARTTVTVSLNAPELLVEITVTACIPR